MDLKVPRTRYLGMVTGLKCYLVDGEHVRNHQDIDFVCGGNEAVYPNYVPKNEIWIDEALSPLDRTATLLHEIVERNHMVTKGWSYDKAHDAASAVERPFRKELIARPSRGVDLVRVEARLATLGHPAESPKAPSKHDREYPRVAGVGKRRRTSHVKRDIDRMLVEIATKRDATRRTVRR